MKVTTIYRVRVQRVSGDTRSNYTICLSEFFSTCRDAIPGAWGDVEKFLGGPVSGLSPPIIESASVVYPGEIHAELAEQYAEEEDWSLCDEWDHAHPNLREENV